MGQSETVQAAFKAIGEEAERLLGTAIEGEIREVIERIISIARYQIDNRTEVEQQSSRLGEVGK